MIRKESVVQGILPGNRPGAKNGLSRVFSPGGRMSSLRYCLVLSGLVLLVSLAGAAAPVARFTADDTYGPAPLAVHFTDLSLNTPTAWAWFFGDEDFTEAWTEMNGSSGWGLRSHPNTVALQDGSIVLIGGYSVNYVDLVDVWRSTDKGATWKLKNASPGWTPRFGSTSVALPDGSIVMMGGTGPLNDVWRSTDNGTTWIQRNASSAWAARYHARSVVLPDGSIVLMGGFDNSNRLNDTWRSTNKGATWLLRNGSSGWARRSSPGCVALPDGSIVLTGGTDGTNMLNDTWRSTDKGATWTQMSANAGWVGRAGHSTVAMPDGSIVLMGGDIVGGGDATVNDVWRSTDKGATWTRLPDPCWTTRQQFGAVALLDGSIVIMGGMVNENKLNDTWRFQPVGAAAQHPTHTYTKPGIYQVALQARNPGGYNLTRKMDYIKVTGPTNVGVFRPSSRNFILKTGATTKVVTWGLGTDIPVTGDWNRDGQGDVGVYRPDTQKFILKNGSAKTEVPWGLGTDTPVTGDWNGDDFGDVGVYRPSAQLFILKNGTAKTVVAWGLGTDIPVTGDWDGNGLTDVGVYRPSIATFILDNGTKKTVVPWGLGTDIPVSGDWNSDGLGDVGVYRPSTQLFILKDGTKKTVIPWGQGSDIPVTGIWR